MVICIYCGDNEATERINSPNGLDDEPFVWDVCADCKEVITLQQKLSFGMVLGSTALNESIRNYAEKVVSDANKQLDKIAKRTGKPILNACISKKKDGSYETASVEFTGEK